MKKYKYSINNLDCANCAREIEEFLNNKKEFNNVIVNFNTCKISYESDIDYNLNDLNKLVKSIEPDAYLTNIDESVEKKKEYHISTLILGILVGILSYYLDIPNYIKYIGYIVSYGLLLYRVGFNAIKMLINKKGINEYALITISCIGALLIGEVLEGIMVIGLYSIGKILEEKAINNSRKSISDLMNIKEPFAYLKNGKNIDKIPVEDVQVGDLLLVKKGEKIPVDSIIYEGTTTLDTSSLTGESDEITVSKNDTVLSGSINTGDVIVVKAIHVFKDSTVSKILELLENATNKKAKTETIISKISKIYTPVVLILAIMVTILLPILFNVEFTDSLYRGLTFLVISCPCAIAISIPLSYFTGIGCASKNGVLIKGSNYLDNLSNIKNIIFDKTGTLTTGSFNVVDLIINDNNYSKDEIIDILLSGESYSNHPIAKSIMKLKSNYNKLSVTNYKEISGMGITYTIGSNNIMVGNSKLCNCNSDGLVHININNKHVGFLNIDDGIKDNAKEVISYLNNKGINTYMFTGDKKSVALTIGNKLGIKEIKYEMLPTDKYECYEDLANSSNGITAFVGDGINDAPVLKRADIGISLGNIGTDSAISASDIVLMSDELNKIPLAIDISYYTKKIIKENLIFALSIKLIILLLSVLGLANMFLAVFADTGVTLLTIINTLRIINKFK